MVLLNTHNIRFGWEIGKLNFRYALLIKFLLFDDASILYSQTSKFVSLVTSNMFQPSSKFLIERYKAVLLLWTLFIFCVSCLSFSYCLVCPMQPCGQIQENGWLLVSCMWCFLVALSFSHMVSLVICAAWSVSMTDLCLLAYLSLNFISSVQ